MNNNGSRRKIKSTLIEQESSKGEISWPAPQDLSDQALQEICEELAIPKSKRHEFCTDLRNLRSNLAGLIADMKLRGTNSKHRDDWIKSLKNTDSIIDLLEAVVDYGRQRSSRIHLESPVVPMLSRAAANFLPALFDPRLLLSIEGSTPLHIGQMERVAHMSWLRRLGADHGPEALLSVYRIWRNSMAAITEELESLTKASRRPQNILGPELLRAFSGLCIEYLLPANLDVSPKGQIYKLALAFCHNTGLPTSWIQSQFKRTVPEYLRERVKNNMP